MSSPVSSGEHGGTPDVQTVGDGTAGLLSLLLWMEAGSLLAGAVAVPLAGEGLASPPWGPAVLLAGIVARLLRAPGA